MASRDPNKSPERDAPLAREPASAEASDSVQVRINGEIRTIPSGLDLRGLLKYLEIQTSRVAIERNRAIVPKTAHETTRLEPGDEIEIVSFIGGG